jgi:tetratricopeptide (TPR) repeat protein
LTTLALNEAMSADAALVWADALIFASTGAHLNDLQTMILQQVWQGRRYLEIAQQYGCTEGHAKDTGAQLWQLLSQALGERVTKANVRAVLERHRVGELGDIRACPWPEHQIPENPSRCLERSTAEPHGQRLNFVGRTAAMVEDRPSAIAHLNTLVSQGISVIVIQGEGGLGKTTLAQRYLQTQDFEVVLELLMAKETENLTPAERVVEEWLKRDLEEEPGREFGVTLARLKRHLQTRRIGILIDNLEPALDHQGCLIHPHRAYVELLRVLADPCNLSLTLITSRDRLCEAEIMVEHYRLPGLPLVAWQQFLETQDIKLDETTLTQVHTTYGGNAKALRVICGAIQEDYEGDLVAYWHDNHQDPLHATTLKNLVTGQITRLQHLDPTAYHLLCRLGCYRYQDIPKLPKAALLVLLWDVESTHQEQVIRSLRNRSLVEFHRGYYWLHPVIRAEAIARLRQRPDWITAHQRAAQFWTQSVTTLATLTDALTAWEAYHHYVEIKEFEAASQVILKSRHNQWGQFLPLGSALYRMGLLQPVLTAIHEILTQITSEANLSELYNILGDLHWITGQIHEALACQEKSIITARQCLQSMTTPLQSEPKDSQQKIYQHRSYYFRMLEIDSFLSMGLYNIDLWNLEVAVTHLEQVIQLAQNTAHYRWAQKASACLALVKSYLGQPSVAYTLAQESYRSILKEQSLESMGRCVYFIQILGQTYTNLGDLSTALDLYRQAIRFAEDSHYLQVKAKILSGMAEIDRLQGELDAALPRHRQAIALLEEIGAKCDLADAHYQFGLTLCHRGDDRQASDHFAQAVQLFTDIQAPQQVERVRKLPVSDVV